MAVLLPGCVDGRRGGEGSATRPRAATLDGPEHREGRVADVHRAAARTGRDGRAGPCLQTGAVDLSDPPPDASIDTSPGDQRAAAPWTQAAAAFGALKATRDMPEPDSLGG